MEAKRSDIMRWRSIFLLASAAGVVPTVGRADEATRHWTVTPVARLVVQSLGQDGMPVPRLPSGWGFIGNPNIYFSPKSTPSSGGEVQAPVPGTPGQAADFGNSLKDGVPSADLTPLITSVDRHSLWIPVAQDVAVAGYQNNGRATIVLGGKQSLPDSPSDVANDITWRSFTRGNATVIEVSGLVDAHVTLVPQERGGQAGWMISDDVSVLPSENFVTLSQKGATIIFSPGNAMEQKTARTMEFSDPQSGRRLLLGLVSGADWRVPQPMRGPGYDIRRTLAGVVVAADSDALELRNVANGFALDAVGEETVPVQLPHSRTLSVSPGLLLSAAEPDILRENFRRAWTAAALAEPAQRFSARIQASRAALALGDAKNAKAIMDVALQDDPQGVDREGVWPLQRAIGVLHGHLPDMAASADNNTPEDQLWRGLALTVQQQPPFDDDGQRAHTAELLVAGLSTLEHYPAPLRAALKGPATEWIARYGKDLAPDVFAGLPDDGDRRLASALDLSRRDGADALPALEAVSHDVDLVRAAKAREAFLLYAHKKDPDPLKLAKALDILRPSSRIAGREPQVLIEQIHAYMDAGRWTLAEQSLADLARVSSVWKDEAERVRQDLLTRMQSARQNVQKLTPEDASDLFVAFRQAADSAGHGSEEASTLLQALADSYGALGLRDREVATLHDLLPQISDPTRKQTVVDHLAALLLASGKPQDAAAFLKDQPADDQLTPDRRVLQARIEFAAGKDDAALARLAGVETDAAYDLRARIAESRQDWPGAVAALQKISTYALAPIGPLAPEQQVYMARLCGDAVRAGNVEVVARVQRDASGRITDPELKKIMSYLTVSAPQSSTALSRR